MESRPASWINGVTWRSTSEPPPPYQNADLGYRASYGDRDAYRLQFRDGFEREYQEWIRAVAVFR